MKLVNAILWFTCAAIWFYRAAVEDQNGSSVLVGAIMAVCGVVWLVRYFKEKKENGNG